MELAEIKQLTHKIKKISLQNKNHSSTFNYITQKITLTDVQDEEVVRFSLEENSEYIQHQSFNNDYYIIIPNNLNTITYIYVHYFPSELYTYEEDENISFSFDFTELLQAEDNKCSYITASDGHQYPVFKSGSGYTMEPGTKQDSLIVRSTLSDSIDGYKNPNYKEITETSNTADKTEQGYFPLSGRYRNSHQYFNQAPNLKNNPQWQASIASEGVCKQKPYWEVRINRDGLSRLIANTIDGEYASIAVNLNYQYLPTSTRQHQHYYGFEDDCPDKDDIFVMESTNMNEVNDNFNSDTYRIIKRANPYDNDYTMRVDHECILPLELLDFTPKGYITKNRCYNYYIYTAIGNEIPSITKNLVKDEQYSLRYFIFVPNNVDTLVQEYNNNLPPKLVEKFDIVSLNGMDDIVSYDDSSIIPVNELISVENGSLISKSLFAYLNYWRGKAYIKKGWNNSDEWEISFRITTPNRAQYGGYVLIKYINEPITNNNVWVNAIGIRSNGVIDIYDNNGNRTIMVDNGYEWRTDSLDVVIQKTNNHYKVLLQHTFNSNNKQVFEFDSNIFNNIKGNLNLVLTASGNFYGDNITLSNAQYSYFIEEPADTSLLISSDCYLSVNGERIPDEFLRYDRDNRGKWIYHEVPFISQGEDEIRIIGPHDNPDIQFFLTGVEIEKFIPYSPTLTYNKSGLTISENLDWDKLCKSENEYTSGQTNKVPDVEGTEWQIKPATNVWKKRRTLESPKGKIFIILNEDVEFDYDDLTTNFHFFHPDDCEYKLIYNPNTTDLTQTTNDENTYLEYDEITTDLYAIYPRNVLFYKGPNNSFYLYLVDEYDNPVNRGTLEVEFVKYPNEGAEQLVYAGKKIVSNGSAFFNKIDLSNIEVINGEPTKYYLRIKYEDPCFDEGGFYDYKVVYVELPNTKMVPIINGNYKNKRFIGYTTNGKPIYGDDCNQYKNSKHYKDDFDNNTTISYDVLENPNSIRADTGEKIYQGQWNHYYILDTTAFKKEPHTNIRGGYYVYDVEEEFPLNISAYIYNQTSSEHIGAYGVGYCELSVDDKVIQTTIVDTDGKADFYLDLTDVPFNKHIIKIEYYNEYWKTIDYFYFNLVICDDPTKVRPSVPIIFKKFPYCPGHVKTNNDNDSNVDNTTKCEFFYLKDVDLQLYIPQDDTLMLDMENTEHTHYNLSLYRHKSGFKNISKFTNANSILIDSVDIYGDPKLSLFFATGLEFDTTCRISSNNTENLHPSFVQGTRSIDKIDTKEEDISGTETAQIEKLQDLIISHGENPYQNIRNKLHNSIQQVVNATIYPEMLNDTMLYAPIKYVQKNGTGNSLSVYLKNFYLLNDKNENIVYYSLVTNNIAESNIYRQFKRTFGIHYMNYIEATNYAIQPFGSDPIYYLNDEGYWVFNKIKIKQTSRYKEDDNKTVDDDDFIKEGGIEIYMNGRLYQFARFYENGEISDIEFKVTKEIENTENENTENDENSTETDTTENDFALVDCIENPIDYDDESKYEIVDGTLKIPKETNNDIIQLRYVFKDGYHFVTY